jgi:hypothetical protein
VVVIEGIGVYQAVADLRTAVVELRQSQQDLGRSPSTWTAVKINLAARNQADAALRAGRAEQRLRSDLVVNALLVVPYAKDQVRTAVDLAAALSAATKADGDVIDIARAYVARPPAAPTDSGQQLLSLLQAVAPKLAEADQSLAPATSALDADSKRPLIGPIRKQLDGARTQLRPVADAVHSGSVAARLLPAALGANGVKTYLILLPNPSELRPTGGFSGEVGRISIDHGRVTELVIQNEADINAAFKERFVPQGQAGTYLSFANDQWDIGDAGWDADFPTSVKLQERMYTSATGRQLDGTISADPYFFSALLSVTGPVELPGYGMLDSNNLYLRTNVLTNVETGPLSGKTLLPLLAKTIIAKVLAQPANRWPELGSVLQDAAVHRHLQVVVHEPQLGAELHHLRLDGALQNLPLTQDYVMVAEANVAATKADYYIKRSMDIKVEIYPSGLNRHEIDIHYEYPVATDATDAALNRSAYNPNSLYRDYVRFYLPLTTTLANIGFLQDGKPAPANGGGLKEQGPEGGHQVYGTFFTLPRGHSADLIIYYEVGLPADPPFQIYIQKQAGLVDLPTTLTVSYPGGIASRKTGLATDTTLTVPW